MVDLAVVDVNGRWPLVLPKHRADRPEWPWWEATRLAAENHAVKALVKRLHPRRPVVWCVGAEEGDFPALYSTWGADVVLLEPNPKVWPNIKAIWDANQLRPPVGLFVGLVGSPQQTVLEPAELDYKPLLRHDVAWPVCAYGPVIGDHGFRHLADGRATTVTVTLDYLHYTIGLPAPDMMTMDIEGGEAHALAGARHLLEEHRPDLFVSIHPEFLESMYEQHPDRHIHHVLEALDYTGVYLGADHEQHWWYQPERTSQ